MFEYFNRRAYNALTACVPETGELQVTTTTSSPTLNIPAYCDDLADQAVTAGRDASITPGRQRDAALRAVAKRMREQSAALIRANALDLEAGQAAGLSEAMLDRLKIDDARIEKMAKSVEEIAEQTDPVGQIIEGSVRPNGIRLQKVRTPIGVVLIIFESRPNVTSDAAALCLKSGNACILRGGKEAIHSNTAIAEIVQLGLADAGLNPKIVQLVDVLDREVVGHLLKQVGKIDVVIPRGGESLIRRVVADSHIPVIKHYTGNCHVYVDAAAEDDMAASICVNAKTQRIGVCNATETILFHADAAERGLLRKICKQLTDAGVEVRGDETTCKLFPEAKPADESDWAAEYLDMIVAVRVLPDLDAAALHINTFGSKHTDAIVTKDIHAADRFVQRVDSANVFVNCSTRFSDGGEYGLGAEIGISTDKLHARGPMGAADLTTYKWVAYGNGQIRE